MTKALSTLNEAPKPGQGQDVGEDRAAAASAATSSKLFLPASRTLMAIMVVGLVVVSLVTPPAFSGQSANHAALPGAGASESRPTWLSAAPIGTAAVRRLDLHVQRRGVRRSCIVAPRATYVRITATGLHLSCLSAPSRTTSGSAGAADIRVTTRDMGAPSSWSAGIRGRLSTLAGRAPRVALDAQGGGSAMLRDITADQHPLVPRVLAAGLLGAGVGLLSGALMGRSWLLASTVEPSTAGSPPRASVDGLALRRLPVVLPAITVAPAPCDTTPSYGNGGIVAHPREPMMVFDRPGGQAFARLEPTLLGAAAFLPVIAKQPGWVQLLLPAR